MSDSDESEMQSLSDESDTEFDDEFAAVAAGAAADPDMDPDAEMADDDEAGYETEGTETTEANEADDLQKFRKIDRAEIKTNILEKYYPELVVHNSKEADLLSKVIRDQSGKIIDPHHKMTPFLTKYEKTRILGERTKQLDAGGDAFIEVPAGIVDNYWIACEELRQKKIPFIIYRPLPHSTGEYWPLDELEFI